VGGTYTPTNGVQWGTGEAANYSNWYPGYPLGTSGYMALLVGWNDEPLGRLGYVADSTSDLPYVCEEDLA